MTLGRFPDVGLSTARRAAVDIKDRIKAGEDPRESRKAKALKLANVRQQEIAFDSFEAVALQQLAVWSKGKDKKTILDANSRLSTFVFPHIGERPVASLISADFVSLLQTLELRAPVTAKKRSSCVVE